MSISRITPQHEVISQNDIKGDTILVPSSQIAFFLVDLPTKSRTQAQKLAGFAIEDELSQEIEELHFAVIPRQNRWLVAVIENRIMQEWLEVLHLQGIKPKRLIPDVMAMDKTISILEEPHQILVKQLTNTDEQTTEDTDTNDNQQLSASTPDEKEAFDFAKPFKDFIACGVSAPLLKPLLDFWEVNLKGLNYLDNKNYRDLLESNLNIDSSCINLLQGDYAESHSLLALTKPWLISFVLACFISVSYSLSLSKTNQELESQLKLSREENTALFRRTFPNTKRIVNIRAQAETRFREIQKIKKLQSGGFIQLLNLIIPTLINHNNVVLESIRYRKFNVTLRLSAANVSTIEALIQNLKQNAQLDIRPDSLRQENGKTKSLIQISKNL